jgi:hypothetical protein
LSPQTFASFVGLCVGFIAALFFCLGTARLTNADLFRLSGTYWNHSRPFFESLSTQRADYICGATLLVVSFLAQGVSIFLPSAAMIISATTCVLVASAFIIISLVLAMAARRKIRAGAMRYFEAEVARDNAQKT